MVYMRSCGIVLDYVVDDYPSSLPHLAFTFCAATSAFCINRPRTFTVSARLCDPVSEARIIYLEVTHVALYVIIVVTLACGDIVPVVIHPRIGEAQLLSSRHVHPRENRQQRFLDVCLIDVARVQDAVGVAAVVLCANTFKHGRTADYANPKRNSPDNE